MHKKDDWMTTAEKAAAASCICHKQNSRGVEQQNTNTLLLYLLYL